MKSHFSDDYRQWHAQIERYIIAQDTALQRNKTKKKLAKNITENTHLNNLSKLFNGH